MSGLSIAKDLRSRFGAVRDQGQRGTCLAFAMSDTHAGVRTGWTELSCEYLYFHGHKRGGSQPPNGAPTRAMGTALAVDGQPVEADWPYLPALPTDLKAWQPPPVGALFRRGSRPVVPTVAEVVRLLDDDQPVVVMIKVTPSFDRPLLGGIVRPVAGEAVESPRRHAVIAVAHGLVDGERAVLIRNSWGTWWGDGGYGWLLEAFLEPRLYDALLLVE